MTMLVLNLKTEDFSCDLSLILVSRAHVSFSCGNIVVLVYKAAWFNVKLLGTKRVDLANTVAVYNPIPTRWCRTRFVKRIKVFRSFTRSAFFCCIFKCPHESLNLQSAYAERERKERCVILKVMRALKIFSILVVCATALWCEHLCTQLPRRHRRRRAETMHSRSSNIHTHTHTQLMGTPLYVRVLRLRWQICVCVVRSCI